MCEIGAVQPIGLIVHMIKGTKIADPDRKSLYKIYCQTFEYAGVDITKWRQWKADWKAQAKARKEAVQAEKERKELEQLAFAAQEEEDARVEKEKKAKAREEEAKKRRIENPDSGDLDLQPADAGYVRVSSRDLGPPALHVEVAPDQRRPAPLPPDAASSSQERGEVSYVT